MGYDDEGLYNQYNEIIFRNVTREEYYIFNKRPERFEEMTKDNPTVKEMFMELNDDNISHTLYQALKVPF